MKNTTLRKNLKLQDYITSNLDYLLEDEENPRTFESLTLQETMDYFETVGMDVLLDTILNDERIENLRKHGYDIINLCFKGTEVMIGRYGAVIRNIEFHYDDIFICGIKNFEFRVNGSLNSITSILVDVIKDTIEYCGYDCI